MGILAILKLAPVVLSVVEIIKRFIPDKQRKVINPIIAAVTGLLGAYTFGGQAEVLEVLTTGLSAAVVAIAAYKVPKEIGKSLGIK